MLCQGIRLRMRIRIQNINLIVLHPKGMISPNNVQLLLCGFSYQYMELCPEGCNRPVYLWYLRGVYVRPMLVGGFIVLEQY